MTYPFLRTALLVAILFTVVRIHHVAAGVASAPSDDGSPLAAAGKRNGINFLNGEWSSRFKYDSSGAAESLHQLQTGTGLNWIALTYCYFQKTVDSTGPIYPRSTSPTEAQLEKIVALAHQNDIKVFMRPCIDPDWSNPVTHGTWRGQIGRHFNDSDWNVWFFDNYKPFVVEQAKVAQRVKADMFSVGMEYTDASRQTNHWLDVINGVREVYSAGVVTYCANWGNELLVQFWDVLDEISIDAYYPLAATKQSPSVEELVDAWSLIVDEIAVVSMMHGDKPVNFAEIGYCSVTGANTDPAHCGLDAKKTVNVTAQENLYEAFFQKVYPQKWFKGIFWWAWLTDVNNAGVNNTGFTPHGKPAEAVMKQYYSP